MSQQRSLEPVAEEGRGENEVMQLANPATNAAVNPATNPAVNVAANPPANATVNAANTQANTTANPRQNTGAQPSPVQANHTEGNQRRRIRDEVEIARRANYDRDHGVPDTLDAHNPIQATELRNMHDQDDVHSTTMTTDLPMTSTSSRQPTPRRQARVRSTTSVRSHDVSGRSDTP
jgi:hypothetical protein